MMLYATQPTDQGRKELERMARWEDRRVKQRAQMILLSIRRKKTLEIADLVGVRPATVRLWLHRFNAYGPDGLYDRERSGRPRKATQTAKHTLGQPLPERRARASHSGEAVVDMVL
jgi:transposase